MHANIIHSSHHNILISFYFIINYLLQLILNHIYYLTFILLLFYLLNYHFNLSHGNFLFNFHDFYSMTHLSVFHLCLFSSLKCVFISSSMTNCNTYCSKTCNIFLMKSFSHDLLIIHDQPYLHFHTNG